MLTKKIIKIKQKNSCTQLNGEGGGGGGLESCGWRVNGVEVETCGLRV
jgi:hypothetical protein